MGMDNAPGSALWRRAMPPAFNHVQNGEALLFWQPNIFRAARIMPHLFDDTYSAMVFRTCRFHNKHNVRVHTITMDNEDQALVMRVKDIKYVIVLAQWFNTCLRTETPSSDLSHLRTSSYLIGNLMHMLIGNCCSSACCEIRHCFSAC